MFVKEGWSSPKSFLRRFIELEEAKVQRASATALVDSRHRAEASLAKLLNTARYGGIMLPDGTVVSVDDAFLSRVESASPFRHALFDLETGEVGRVTGIWKGGIQSSILKMARLRLTRWLLLTAVLDIIIGIVYSTYLYLFRHNIFVQEVERVRSSTTIFVLLIFGIICTLLIPAVWIFKDMRRKKFASKVCRSYAGGHLIIPDQVFEEFVRTNYASPTTSSADQTGGRPRHPAYDWYAGLGFNRKELGLTMKELQAQMPRDENGNPPAPTTIREWEREHLQQKGAAET